MAYVSRRKRKGQMVPGANPASRPDKRARGGGLDTEERSKLPSSDFALPGKGDGPKGKGPGSYPIPNKTHARSALSRGAQHASPAEQAKIKRKVHAKFPGIKIDGE
jgi:hypothetical protein